MSHFSQNILLFLRGVVMGAVDLVPGISAGTVALVTGIYPQLINSIKSFNLHALKILRTDGFSAAWQYINGNFLVILISGMLLSLFSLATLMQFLLATYPLPLWSFFTGLIVASVVYLLRQNPLSRVCEVGLFGLGAAFAYAISIAPPIAIEGNYVSMFFAGSIALCAMIMPGISGSFVLLLLGLYPVFINALANVDMGLLAVFAAGGVVGLMLFSRLLSWLLSHYKNAVIATMCGFLVGSLGLIWPWKQLSSTVSNDSGGAVVLSSVNLSPLEYSAVMGQDPQITSCAIAFLVALLIVLSMEIMANRFREQV